LISQPELASPAAGASVGLVPGRILPTEIKVPAAQAN